MYSVQPSVSFHRRSCLRLLRKAAGEYIGLEASGLGVQKHFRDLALTACHVRTTNMLKRRNFYAAAVAVAAHATPLGVGTSSSNDKCNYKDSCACNDDNCWMTATHRNALVDILVLLVHAKVHTDLRIFHAWANYVTGSNTGRF